jgi:integrase
VHRTLRKALADAVNVEQLLPDNPAARSKRPKISKPEPAQIWTIDPAGSFLTAARSHRLFAFYRLAAYTGARRGELLYLRWDALDLDAAEVTFSGSTTVVRSQRVEGATKGGRSRTISIDSETVTVLREHQRQQAEECQAAGSTWTDSGGLVFTTRWGEPLYPDTVSALMNKLISEYNESVAPPGAATAACPTAQSAAPARHHTAARRGPRPCGSCPPRPRRSGRHIAGLLARTA